MKLPAPMYTSYPTPQAIPTKYCFHLFRSRLEATWAVFFNKLGIRWTYEPEGFSLRSTGYIPDFRIVVKAGGFGAVDGLIDAQFFCEVKHHGAAGSAWSKAREFSLGAPILQLEGKPFTQAYPCLFRGEQRYWAVFEKGGVFMHKDKPDGPVSVSEEVEEAIDAACSERFGT